MHLLPLALSSPTWTQFTKILNDLLETKSIQDSALVPLQRGSCLKHILLETLSSVIFPESHFSEYYSYWREEGFDLFYFLL